MTSAVNRRRGNHLQPGETCLTRGLQLDNSGRGPLRAPGFAGLPLTAERPPADRFAHGSHDWAQPRLTAREVAMLRAMNTVTDAPGWERALLAVAGEDGDDGDDGDEAAVAGLRPGMAEEPLLSDAAWAWCVDELRDKARKFAATGRVAVYDSASGLVKSDVLVSGALLDRLRMQVDSLIAEQDASAAALSDPTSRSSDEDPDTGAPIRHLVDPAMYPLVYGKTRVLSEGGVVGLEDATEAIGSGQPVPGPAPGFISAAELLHDPDALTTAISAGVNMRMYRWSCHTQWLPCEVEFCNEVSPEPGAGAEHDVRITSYINNLHPVFRRSMYGTIGRVISLSVGPWNDVLVFRDHYRRAPRIRTYGVSWTPPYPDWAYDLEPMERKRWSQLQLERQGARRDPRLPRVEPLPPHERQELERQFRESQARVDAYLDRPSDWRKRDNLLFRTDDVGIEKEYRWNSQKHMFQEVRDHHNAIRTGWEHPEPGDSFSYENWKARRSDRAIIPNARGSCRWDTGGGPISVIKDEHDFYERTVRLQETFRHEGLQVVVKLSTIEMTPERPSYKPGGGGNPDAWDYGAGLLNEHVVATTLLCVSSVNATPYVLRLRVEADMYANEYHYDRYPSDELAATFGVVPATGAALDAELDEPGPALQELGTVALPPGRLLVVPAVVNRRLDRPVMLVDPTRPGRVCVLALHLVDPHYRVCSTRNAPPQQHAWWASAAGLQRMHWAVGAGVGMPREVADMVVREVGEFPMGQAEAELQRRQREVEERLGNVVAEMGVGVYLF